MKSLVVDASVVAKWVLPEVHSDAARDLLSVAEVLAPDLLWAELGNVLWRARRDHEALACYRRAMALSPDLIEAWTNLGLVQLDLGVAGDVGEVGEETSGSY